MRLKQMIELFRDELADTQEPFMWQTKELVHYLNLAVQEACERAFLIEDRHTPSVCQFVTQSGVDSYTLHASIIKIKRITVASKLLHETSVEELDAQMSGWEGRTGKPHSFILEGPQGGVRSRVRLVPTPTVEAQVQMTVYRGALQLLKDDYDTGEPEIPPSLRDGLKHWVYRCALLKTDADAHNAVRAQDHEQMFDGIFGLRTDASVVRKRRDRRPPVIQSAW